MNLVKDIMIKDPSICTVTTSIDNIKKIMTDTGREEVLLVDTLVEGHVLGKINSNTISKVSTEKSVLPSQLSAEQCMTPIEAVVGQNVSVEDCLRLMDENHMSRIPVVDEHGHCTGIVDKEKMTEKLIPGEEYASR